VNIELLMRPVGLRANEMKRLSTFVAPTMRRTFLLAALVGRNYPRTCGVWAVEALWNTSGQRVDSVEGREPANAGERLKARKNTQEPRQMVPRMGHGRLRIIETIHESILFSLRRPPLPGAIGLGRTPGGK
jgi:hypothetical protein